VLDGPTPGSAADLAADADPEAVARLIAIRLLTAAPRTRTQLAQALARRGVPDDVVAQLLDRFEDVGLVDDEEFARMWVSSRSTGRGLSRRALRHELTVRGIDAETVQEAVGALGAEDELECARALVRRKWAASAGQDPQRRVRRLLGVLARKGYGSDVAFRAVRDVTGERLDAD
jgi:regulatory protein